MNLSKIEFNEFNFEMNLSEKERNDMMKNNIQYFRTKTFRMITICINGLFCKK